ncbi:gamma-glutamylcyclotransferase family protein [Cedecea neteri]|uniref:Gamma-glutamylcyclotransferase n=2 Tax=Cedecea neteri TaxID=158822 RepID=A0A291E6I1_9ENTR|nr:gamma-glutamylcyclotransferase family protein [Cedecea neteri]ATF95543.1 gamma-glutamylcyclotransferase [Cedecea neteri]
MWGSPVYGTLGPGRPNAHIIEYTGGTWQEGHVVGSLLNKDWGAEMGFPGIVLDDFEGAEYERVPVDVMNTDGEAVKSCSYMFNN